MAEDPGPGNHFFGGRGPGAQTPPKGKNPEGPPPSGPGVGHADLPEWKMSPKLGRGPLSLINLGDGENLGRPESPPGIDPPLGFWATPQTFPKGVPVSTRRWTPLAAGRAMERHFDGKKADGREG